MRSGVFADVHGNLAALAAIVADGQVNGVDSWVCLGDVAFRGPQPAECAEMVARLPGIIQIAGNTDLWLSIGFPATLQVAEERRKYLEVYRVWGRQRLNGPQLATLRNLPLTHLQQYGSDTVMFTHAAPGSPEAWIPANADEDTFSPLWEGHLAEVVCSGHIHVPYLRRLHGRLLINTGSVGHPTDGDNRASYVIISDEGGAASVQFKRVRYNVAATVAAAQECGLPLADAYAQALQAAQTL